MTNDEFISKPWGNPHKNAFTDTHIAQIKVWRDSGLSWRAIATLGNEAFNLIYGHATYSDIYKKHFGKEPSAKKKTGG